MKKLKARPAAGAKANGLAAWAALSAQYDGNTVEARRFFRENLLHASMKSLRDPRLIFSRRWHTYGYAMGEQFSMTSSKTVIFRGILKEYDIRRLQSHSDCSFDLHKIMCTSLDMIIDELSRINFSEPVAGRAMAMAVPSVSDTLQTWQGGRIPGR